VTYKEFNSFCDSLSYSSHVIQWGGAHVWKVSGKVFAIGGWEKSDSPAYTFKVSEVSFEILKDEPGLRPAPYFASRGMSWIQHYGKSGLPDDELKEYLLESHRIVSMGFSKKKRKELGLYI
jgi:predicted DNA-binding protein (MmcQ/YjbR family)